MRRASWEVILLGPKRYFVSHFTSRKETYEHIRSSLGATSAFNRALVFRRKGDDWEHVETIRKEETP